MFKDFECMMDMEDMNCENKHNDNHNHNENCNMNSCIDNMPLAMAYVPMQKWKNVYNNDVALKRGTIFPELDLPFLGGRDRE